jgi:hypothetical protein
MKLEIRTFSGIAPRFSPELLNEQNGQKAVNLSIKSGKIHPEKKFTIKFPDRDYVAGLINDDPYNRLYFLAINSDTDSNTDGDDTVIPPGTLCMCGTFPNEDGVQSDDVLCKRTVDIPIPGTPQFISVSSPFLDAFNDSDSDAKMFANYGSTSWKATRGVATHIYGIYELVAIDQEWQHEDNNTLTRTYQYNPWTTTIWYPQEYA